MLPSIRSSETLLDDGIVRNAPGRPTRGADPFDSVVCQSVTGARVQHSAQLIDRLERTQTSAIAHASRLRPTIRHGPQNRRRRPQGGPEAAWGPNLRKGRRRCGRRDRVRRHRVHRGEGGRLFEAVHQGEGRQHWREDRRQLRGQARGHGRRYRYWIGQGGQDRWAKHGEAPYGHWEHRDPRQGGRPGRPGAPGTQRAHHDPRQD